MRIVHVVKKYPEVTGGDGIVVARLRREQEAAGHHVTVLTSRSPEVIADPAVHQIGRSSSAAELDGMGPGRLLSLTWLALSAWWRLRRLGAEVVHTHGIDVGLAVAPAAHRLGLPVVHTCHDLAAENPHVAWWKPAVERRMYAAARFSAVAALTEGDADRLRRAGIGSVTVIPNGVD